MSDIAQHQATPAVVPVAGDALASATVRADINALTATYNEHDADALMHVQIGPVASRPASDGTNGMWITDVSPRIISIDTGSGWVDLDYAPAGSNIPDQAFYLAATRI